MNRTLLDLDLRGNGCGDTLLFHVAKLLKYNGSLLSLYLDENETTDKGWQVCVVGGREGRESYVIFLLVLSLN